MSSLSGISKHHPLGVAYCLTKGLSQTLAEGRIMLYCTWWPSALTNQPQGQVSKPR